MLVPPAQRAFIKEHELAHCEHDVFDEIEADRIGFGEFVSDGGKPQTALQAIAQNLDMSHPKNQARYAALLSLIQSESMYPTTIAPISHFGPDFTGTVNQPAGSSTPEASNWLDFLDTIISGAPEIIGAATGNYNAYPYQQQVIQQQQRQSNNTLLIVLGAVVFIILLVFLLKK